MENKVIEILNQIENKRNEIRNSIEKAIEPSENEKNIPVIMEHYKKINEISGDFGKKWVNFWGYPVKDGLKETFFKYPNMRNLYIFLVIEKLGLKNLINLLFQKDPSVADSLSRKDYDNLLDDSLFKMENICKLDDRSMQRMMRELDEETIAKAIIGQPYTVKDKFFRNMSDRAAESVLKKLKKIEANVTDAEINASIGTIYFNYHYLLEREEIFYE